MSGDNWATPPWLFSIAETLYGEFDIDVCASKENAKCPRFYTEDQNGLNQDWARLNWCNPPYSKIGPWVRKAHEESLKGKETVMLLPADFSTRWARDLWYTASHILICNQRIKFVGATNSPKFGSMFAFVYAKRVQRSILVGDAPRISLIDLRRAITGMAIMDSIIVDTKHRETGDQP